MSKTYEIYVADDNGWFDSCPSYQDVFFGPRDGYTAESDHEGGCLLVTGYRAACAMLRELNTTGDWVASYDEETGTQSRPRYAMQERREAIAA
jgi:hypothetical protein